MGLFFPQVSLLPLERYAPLLGGRQMQEVALRVADLRRRFAGRVIWNISSSYIGGGVAEMIRSLLAYARGAGVDARWVVIRGIPEFFRITKRLHNAIHGSVGDGSPLGELERRVYEGVNRELALELGPLVQGRDVVIIHDPQPAGMIAELARQGEGAHIIWRSHIGSDDVNVETERGWNFLTPYLRKAGAYVFSRSAYIPPQLDATFATTIPPSIDPFSAKNQPLSDEGIRSILSHSGILEATADSCVTLPSFVREDGTPGRVDRYAEIMRLGQPPPFDIPLVIQVSRWDRLKDPIGVLRGFAGAGAASVRSAHLMLVGPNTRSVADDPEDANVYRQVAEVWHSLPEGVRSRVHLVSLPTVDVEENAAIVNALQRHAAVVVQKSLQEGFGLTVTEAMWKFRPVVASAVGGILDQVRNGVQGLLLDDPSDLSEFAVKLDRLLSEPQLARQMGERGHARVMDRYLGIDSLLRYGALIETLDNRRAVGRNEAA